MRNKIIPLVVFCVSILYTQGSEGYSYSYLKDDIFIKLNRLQGTKLSAEDEQKVIEMREFVEHKIQSLDTIK